jgi:hypothetical protein
MSCRNCYPNGKCSGNCTYDLPPKEKSNAAV